MTSVSIRWHAGRAALAGLVAIVTVVAAGGTAYADDRPIKRPRPAAGVNAGTRLASVAEMKTTVKSGSMPPPGSAGPTAIAVVSHRGASPDASS